MEIISIVQCRICKSKNLVPILSLGEQFVSDFLISEYSKCSKIPLELFLCDPNSGGCGLLQLKHSTPLEMMYKQYWYKSGISITIRNDLKSIVKNVERLSNLKDNDVVVDIGCNDGTLLRFYNNENLVRVGFEPASNLVKEAEVGTTKIINNFFNYDDFRKEFGNNKAKIITAISMFYDLEDPNKFLDDITKTLDPNGVFVIQQNYLVSMLEQNAFDNICVKPDTVILGDNKPISMVSAGNYAIGECGELSEVKNVMQRTFRDNLIQIKPMYLESIVTTPEHPIRIVKKEHFRYECGQKKPKEEDYQLSWVSAKEVKRGDWVVVPKIKQKNTIKNLDLSEFNQMNNPHYRRGLLSIPLNKDTAWLLGLYVAEGHIGGRESNPYINFTLHKKETRLLKKIKSLFESLRYKTHTIFYNNRESMEIRIVCAALARAFLTWVGKGALNKHIPDFIMFAPKEIKIAFLRGLFDGDGYIRGNKVHFHTSSKTLALQTQLMTAALGGMLGISYVKPYPKKIRGRKVKTKDSWQLRGSSKELAEIFGYQHQGNKINHVIVKDDYIFVPVKKVTQERYSGTVHNIETKTKTYLVSNAIVHNCHEHLEYYSLFSMENLLKRHNLEIFDVELNNINGGSFRTYIKFKDNNSIQIFEGADERLKQLREKEKTLGLDDKKIYQDFASRVNEIKEKLLEFIKTEVRKGKKIYIYGASTRGNVTLQFCGIDKKMVTAATDKNPEKWGRKIVGSMIPIISLEQYRKDRPDYLLVLPWHFFEEIKEQEKDYLNSGGKFIVPLPNFRIVEK